MNVLFLGDIFGDPGIRIVEKKLPSLIKKHKVSFVIAQSENATGRKGLAKKEYQRLKKVGVNAFTIGNHLWANEGINDIINQEDIIRPLNVNDEYNGQGTNIFHINDKKIRVSQFLGITFNNLKKPWKQKQANNFFDAFDKVNNNHDFHIIDFHAETTSEKNVFGLYVDGKVDAFIGTHTHVQTADERILPKGTAYITDVGMVGPYNSAIGVSFKSVYLRMRYGSKGSFEISKNKSILNAVLLKLNKKNKNKIKRIFIQ